MFLAAFVCLLFNALAGAILVFISLLALLVSTRRARCGNCGGELHRAMAKSCQRCGASFAFTGR